MNEIVRALRDSEGNNELDCEISELRPLLLKAANLIESMQARLVEYDALAAEYGIDGKTMLTLAKSQIRTAQDNIKLREQLATSQCREKAAVEDIRQACGNCAHSGNPSCPWEGTYHHRGPSGEKIGVCNAWERRGVQNV